MIANKRGGTVVEAAIVSLYLFPFLFGGATLLYGLVAKSLCDRNTYEALICTESGESVAHCENHYVTQLKQLLPFGKLTEFKIHQRISESVANYEFDLLPTHSLLSPSLSFSKSFSIERPLKVRE